MDLIIGETHRPEDLVEISYMNCGYPYPRTPLQVDEFVEQVLRHLFTQRIGRVRVWTNCARTIDALPWTLADDVMVYRAMHAPELALEPALQEHDLAALRRGDRPSEVLTRARAWDRRLPNGACPECGPHGNAGRVQLFTGWAVCTSCIIPPRKDSP